MLSTDQILKAYGALRKAADDYAAGETDGDTLRAAVVDYTDSLRGITITYDSTGRIVRVKRES